MFARLFAISVLMFLLLAVPLNGWSMPLTEPDLDRQGKRATAIRRSKITSRDCGP